MEIDIDATRFYEAELLIVEIHLADDLRQFGQSPVAKPAALQVRRFWAPSARAARDSVLVAAAVLLLAIAPCPAGAVDSAAPTPPVRVAEPNSGPASVLAAVREATAKYLDVDRARADGFVQISGMEARPGIHFMNVNAQLLSFLSPSVNLSSPPMLIYSPTPGGGLQLAAVEYAVTNRPAATPFPGARWFEHESSCHYRDYRDLPSPGDGTDEPVGCPTDGTPRHGRGHGQRYRPQEVVLVTPTAGGQSSRTGPIAATAPRTVPVTAPAAVALSRAPSGSPASSLDGRRRR